MQLSLFDSAPISRKSDKATSQRAAAEIEPKLCGLLAEFVARLKHLGTATANEVAAYGERKHAESIRKRAKECEVMGAIEVCGERVCGVTGRRASVYRERV